MPPNVVSPRKKTVVDRFANGNHAELVVDDLSDDDLGNLFVYHSDISHRDPRIWDKLTAPEHVERIEMCLTRMQNVNRLAVASHRESLETIRADFENGEIDEADLRRSQAEFDSWHQRAIRFDIRVNMALNEFQPLRELNSYSVKGDLYRLIEAVQDYLNEDTDEDDLEEVVNAISSRHRQQTSRQAS